MRSWMAAMMGCSVLFCAGTSSAQTKAPLLTPKPSGAGAKESTDEFDAPGLVPDLKRKKNVPGGNKPATATKPVRAGAKTKPQPVPAKAPTPPPAPPSATPPVPGASSGTSVGPAVAPAATVPATAMPAAASPAAAPLPIPAASSEAPRPIPLGAWATLGLGTSLLITGAVAGIRTLVQSAAVEERCQLRCYQSEIDKQRPRAHLATAGLVLGLAGLGGGITWVLLDRRKQETNSPSVGLRVGPLGVALRGSF